MLVLETMLPIVIYTNKRIFKYYTGFSFFIFIWISRLEKNSLRLIRHEKIHFWQQVELLFVFHWMLYGLFYVISRLNGQGHYISYRYNPFELEAYENDDQPGYLPSRKPYAWTKYFRKFQSTLSKDMTAYIPKDKNIGW